MANGTIPNRNVLVSQYSLGSMPMSAGETMVQGEFNFSNPTGYKRYIIDIHFGNTTNTAYIGFCLSYSINYSTNKINVTGTRDQAASGINPTITAAVIDIPI